jgi:hypothetical protein
LANNYDSYPKIPNAAQDLEHLLSEQSVVCILEKEQRIAALTVEIKEMLEARG